MTIADYSTLVFDCDGVILDSNRVKTEAFRRAAVPYGSKAADALVAHHLDNGGISRYTKFEYFLSHIVAGQDGPGIEELLASYGAAVRDGLMRCDVAKHLDSLRRATKSTRWLVVSGGDQSELREIFAARGLADYFDGGIFGSPDDKDFILGREIQCGNIIQPALFLGDSRFDFEAAQRRGLDFTFVSGWTDLARWEQFVEQNCLCHVQHVTDVLATKCDQNGNSPY